MRVSLALSTLLVVCCTLTPAFADPVTYPPDAGVLNIRDSKYGAAGDGKTDDTVAIQKALTEGLFNHRIVYLPDGVYLVSDTLKWQNPANAGNNVKGWGPFLQMQGQSRAGTIVRLRDQAPGFSNEDKPKAVIATGSSGGAGNKTYDNGEGNEAFENHLRDFTVDTGTGNPGAIGIDYQVSNCGAMRHVSIKGGGYCGISLVRRDNGPGLIKDVAIDGFRFGIRAKQEISHFTFEDVTLTGQTEAGVWIRDAVVAARHIFSKNSVPAIQMSGACVISLFDSKLEGGSGLAAVIGSGSEPRLYVRNLETSGYQGSVRLRGDVQKPVLAEWSSDAPLGDARNGLSLRLPIRETPEFYEADPAQWADAGAPTGEDDTAAAQAALDMGKRTVFFRFGTYKIKQPLIVPPTVALIMGVGSSLDFRGSGDKVIFRFAGGKAADTTIIDRFTVGGGNDVGFAEHTDARTVVLRDICPFLGSMYRNKRGAGPVFLEDLSGAGYYFAPGSMVWARQWNAEGAGSPKILNDGGTIWALGTKHEGAETILENRNGAHAEIWGAFAYTFGADKKVPAVSNKNSSLALQLAGMTFVPNGYFDLLVSDNQNGLVQEVRRAAAVPRGGGTTLPLYLSLSSYVPIQ